MHIQNIIPTAIPCGSYYKVVLNNSTEVTIPAHIYSLDEISLLIKKATETGTILFVDSENYLSTYYPGEQLTKDMAKEIKIINERLHSIYENMGVKDTYKMFGYGSLMQRYSAVDTLKDSLVSMKWGRVNLNNARIFNVKSTIGTGTYLNLSDQIQLNQNTFGSILEITRESLVSIIEREYYYDIEFTELTHNITKDGEFKLDQPEKVFYVIGRNDQYLTKSDPPMLSYLMAICSGIKDELPGEYVKEFIHSCYTCQGNPLTTWVSEFDLLMYLLTAKHVRR